MAFENNRYLLRQYIYEYISKYLSKYPRLVPILEIFTVLILAIGLILNFREVKDTDIVLIIGSILAVLTYFLAIQQSIDAEDMETTGLLNSHEFILIIIKKIPNKRYCPGYLSNVNLQSQMANQDGSVDAWFDGLYFN